MGVFLNVETQRKFLKMASNAELQNRNDTQRRVMNDRHAYYQIDMAMKNKELRRLDSECFQQSHQCLEQETSYRHLQMLNEDLMEQNAHQKKVIEMLTETCDKKEAGQEVDQQMLQTQEEVPVDGSTLYLSMGKRSTGRFII